MMQRKTKPEFLVHQEDQDLVGPQSEMPSGLAEAVRVAKLEIRSAYDAAKGNKRKFKVTLSA